MAPDPGKRNGRLVQGSSGRGILLFLVTAACHRASAAATAAGSTIPAAGRAAAFFIPYQTQGAKNNHRRYGENQQNIYIISQNPGNHTYTSHAAASLLEEGNVLSFYFIVIFRAS